jgi:cyclic pyranopterin phosphate synthase
MDEIQPLRGENTRLSHLDADGRPRMVDVGDKAETTRRAVARGRVYMRRETLELIRSGGAAKGDVISVAHTAGVMAAKHTAFAIPLCHNIALEDVRLRFDLDKELSAVRIEAEVRATGKTGVEMEALHAVSVAALTIYDMCKAVDRGMCLSDIRLHRKEGGKSGLYEYEED